MTERYIDLRLDVSPFDSDSGTEQAGSAQEDAPREAYWNILFDVAQWIRATSFAQWCQNETKMGADGQVLLPLTMFSVLLPGTMLLVTIFAPVLVLFATFQGLRHAPSWRHKKFYNAAFEVFASLLGPLSTLGVMCHYNHTDLVNYSLLSGVELWVPLLYPIFFGLKVAKLLYDAAVTTQLAFCIMDHFDELEMMDMDPHSVAPTDLHSGATSSRDGGRSTPPCEGEVGLCTPACKHPHSDMCKPPSLDDLSDFISSINEVLYYMPSCGGESDMGVIFPLNPPPLLLDKPDLRTGEQRDRYADDYACRVVGFDPYFAGLDGWVSCMMITTIAVVLALIPPVWMSARHPSEYLAGGDSSLRFQAFASFVALFHISQRTLAECWSQFVHLRTLHMQFVVLLYLSATPAGRRALDLVCNKSVQRLSVSHGPSKRTRLSPLTRRSVSVSQPYDMESFEQDLIANGRQDSISHAAAALRNLERFVQVRHDDEALGSFKCRGLNMEIFLGWWTWMKVRLTIWQLLTQTNLVLLFGSGVNLVFAIYFSLRTWGMVTAGTMLAFGFLMLEGVYTFMLLNSVMYLNVLLCTTTIDVLYKWLAKIGLRQRNLLMTRTIKSSNHVNVNMFFNCVLAQYDRVIERVRAEGPISFFGVAVLPALRSNLILLACTGMGTYGWTWLQGSLSHEILPELLNGTQHGPAPAWVR